MKPIGSGSERTNLDVVEQICSHLDAACGSAAGSHKRLISFVRDRPRHDRRYAIDPSKIERPRLEATESFESGLEKTIAWYLANKSWWEEIFRRGDLSSAG